MGKTHMWEAYSKCETKFSYDLILVPLFWEHPNLGPTQKQLRKPKWKQRQDI
jgi:hypothetical protein